MKLKLAATCRRYKGHVIDTVLTICDGWPCRPVRGENKLKSRHTIISINPNFQRLFLTPPPPYTVRFLVKSLRKILTESPPTPLSFPSLLRTWNIKKKTPSDSLYPWPYHHFISNDYNLALTLTWNSAFLPPSAFVSPSPMAAEVEPTPMSGHNECIRPTTL